MPIAPRLTPLTLYGLAGVAVSALVNALTYGGVAAQERVPLVWALHVGVFPLFLVFIVRARRWQGRWGELLRHVPRWAAALVAVLFVFTGVNFMAATAHLTQRGAESPAPGSAAAHAQNVYVARAFSGHWVFFYALPTLFLLYAPAGGADPSDPAVRRRAGHDGQAAA